MMLRRHHRELERVTQKGFTGPKKDLGGLTVPELKEKAKEKGIEGYGNMKKDELIQALKG